MIRIALTALALIGWFGAAQAAQCDDAAARIMDALHASIDHRSNVKVFLKLPPLKSLAVDCYPSLGVDAEWNGPNVGAFALLAAAAKIVLHADPGRTQAGAAHCLKKAANDPDGEADTDFHRLVFECSASKVTTWVGVSAAN